jgi:hypothetical protein
MPEGRLRPRELAPIDEFRFERITGRPARFRIGNGRESPGGREA